jgi:pimeloyl-ACP methyl ester carboxylesterase
MMMTIAIVLAACGRGPADDQAPAPARFEPTAFHVEVHGRGRPVILIPGLGCPGAVWRDTVAHLDGYETHVLTLAGFAGTPSIDAPLAASTQDQLARYVRDRKLDRPVVIGHSFGGFIAYWFAAAAPELVGPTIVVDSGAALGGDNANANAASGRQARALWRDAGDAQFTRQVRDIFGQMTSRPARLAPMLDRVAMSDRRAIGDAIYEQFTTDLRPMLREIRSPVLVVLADGGLQDRMRAHASTVPNHRVVVVPGAKHFVMIDEPERFHAAIEGFLAAHPAAGRAPLASL